MNRIMMIVAMLLLFVVSPCIATEPGQEQTDKKENGLSSLTIISDAKDKAQIKIYGVLTDVDVVALWDDLFIIKNNTEIRNIDIYMECGGGVMFSGFALIDALKQAQREGFRFTVYGSGVIGSMAIPVYACCDERIASRSTIFLIHPSAFQGSTSLVTGAELQSQTDLFNLMQGEYIRAVTEYTNLTKDQLLKMTKVDTWFSAEQAKEWGLVDLIK